MSGIHNSVSLIIGELRATIGAIGKIVEKREKLEYEEGLRRHEEAKKRSALDEAMRIGMETIQKRVEGLEREFRDMKTAPYAVVPASSEPKTAAPTHEGKAKLWAAATGVLVTLGALLKTAIDWIRS